ncbi:hypothetical protein AgCh_004587 [Apium graveolens]
MEDHQSDDAESLVEEKEELVVPPCGGNPIYRIAHFLKPIFTPNYLHLPPPNALLASRPTFKNLENCTLQSHKGALFSSHLDDECKGIANCLKSQLKKVKLGNHNNVSPSAWMDYFMNSGNEFEHEAFLAFWLSKFVIVRSNIAIQDCCVVIPLSQGKRIALAPVVLA